MRSFCLLLLLLSTLSPLAAQPVVDSRYFGSVGSEFNVFNTRDTANLDSVIIGAGRVWNFQWLTSLGLIRYEMKAPSSVPGSINYPSVSLVMSTTSGTSTYNFFLENNTVTGIGDLGGMYPSVFYKNTPAISQLPFGLALGQERRYTVINKVKGVPQDTGYYQFQTVVQYAGYGSVLIPNNLTVPNCVQIKETSIRSRSNSPGGPFNRIDSAITFRWFTPYLGAPVLQMNWIWEYPNGRRIAGTIGYVPLVVATTQPELLRTQLALHPQPANNWVTYELPGEEAATRAIVLDNMGKQITILPVAFGKIQISTLPPGLYTLLIQGRRHTYRARLVKE